MTTYTYRIGAHEQLRTFGRIIDIPVAVANDAADLRQALEQFHDRRLVLVDTAGMSQRDARFAEQIGLVNQGAGRVLNYLVLSAASQYLGLREALGAFGGTRIDGCVLTKVDECATLGHALSALAAHGIPLAYVSEGQRVPEDLMIARAAGVVARAVALAADHADPDFSMRFDLSRRTLAGAARV